MSKKLSVIVNYTKKYNTIERCLNSIKRQDDFIEAYILYNEADEKECLTLKSKYPHFIFLGVNKNDYIKHINKLIREIKTDYFIIVNPDITFSTDFAYIIQPHLEGYDCIITNMGVSDISKKTFEFKPLYDNYTDIVTVFENTPCIWNNIIKTDIVRQWNLHLSGLSMFDQYTFVSLLYTHCNNIKYIEKVLLYKNKQTVYDYFCYRYFLFHYNSIRKIKKYYRKKQQSRICDLIARDLLLPVINNSYSDRILPRRILYRMAAKKLFSK